MSENPVFPAQGPWFAERSGKFWDIQISPGLYAHSFATVHINPYIGMSAEDASSAARLIAAAPETAAERDSLKAKNADLLAGAKLALDLAEGLIKSDYENTSAYLPMMAEIEPIRAAIAKAEGRSDV